MVLNLHVSFQKKKAHGNPLPEKPIMESAESAIVDSDKDSDLVLLPFPQQDEVEEPEKPNDILYPEETPEKIEPDTENYALESQTTDRVEEIENVIDPTTPSKREGPDSIDAINSIDDLVAFVSGISYRRFIKLMSPAEIFQNGYPISCSNHDIASLELKALKRLGYRCGRLLLIETGKDGTPSKTGLSHTFAWFKADDQKEPNGSLFYVLVADWCSESPLISAGESPKDVYTLLANLYQKVENPAMGGIKILTAAKKSIPYGIDYDHYISIFTGEDFGEKVEESSLSRASEPVTESSSGQAQNIEGTPAMEDYAVTPIIPSVLRPIESESKEGRIPLNVDAAVREETPNPRAKKTNTPYDNDMETLESMIHQFNLMGALGRKQFANKIYQFILARNLQYNLSANVKIWKLVDVDSQFNGGNRK